MSTSPSAQREFSSPLLQVFEFLGDAGAPGEVPHRSEVEPALLAQVDREGVLEILLATPSELHHDRVLGGGEREPPAAPRNASLGPQGLPAARLGLADRGLVRKGYKADLVVFDLRALRDAATFERPKRPARSIRRVLVNGDVVARRGTSTGRRAGTVLRRTGAKGRRP